MLPRAFACLIALPLAAISHAQDFRVTNIKLGSSYTDAITQLKSRGFQVAKNVTFPSSDFTGVILFDSKRSPNNAGSATTGWDRYAIQGYHGRVVLIDHSVRFPTQALPNADQTIHDLRGKYGAKLTDEDLFPALNGQMLWYYDGRNQLLSQQKRCGVNVGGYTGGEVDVADPMQTLRSDCDTEVRAVLETVKANPHLADEMRVTVVDIKDMRGFAEQLTSQRQQQVNRQTEGAKQNKAPL